VSDFRSSIDAASLKPGRVTSVEIDGKWYAVANDRGTFHATGHACPHANGPMGQGDVEDGCLVCPIHAWPFDLKTGLTDPRMPSMRLDLYRCEVRDGKVYVDVSAPLPPPLPEFNAE
jgi:nitrite reductase/ring-hydroxylating ferredoxin subunit